MNAEHNIYLRYAVSLAIGILVGMQRQIATARDGKELALGVRTLGLIGLLGCAGAQLSALSQSIVPVTVTLGILGAYLTAHFVMSTRSEARGLTTEIAALITFVSGVLAYHHQGVLAGALGVMTTLLLSLKIELHAFARNLNQEDVFSTLKFAVLCVVFLPLLPDQTFGKPPFDVLNPFKIGLFMVLMSGVGWSGYVITKSLGSAKGIGLLGLVGGLVSSTAVTLGLTQRSRMEPELSPSFALGIFAAWSVMLIRMGIVIELLNPTVLHGLFPGLAAALAVCLVFSAIWYRKRKPTQPNGTTKLVNPFELGSAFRYGLLFMAILVGARWAKMMFGNAGLYISSFASGLMDVDAIAYSLSKASLVGTLDSHTAANALLLAALANTLLKGGFAMIMGSIELRRAMWPALVTMIFSGSVAMWLF